jgi:hypothetical protein
MTPRLARECTPRHEETTVIAVYVKPEALTVEQYNKARKGLDASGANMEGRKHHSCFGEDGQLMVFEIWDSKESYDAFGTFLMPVLQEVGIVPSSQDIMEVENLEQ